METDDGKRADKGVVVCLRDLGDGSSRLIFDDVIADMSFQTPRLWRHKWFFTWLTYKNKALESGANLSDDDYRKIGMAIVLRLLATNKRVT